MVLEYTMRGYPLNLFITNLCNKSCPYCCTKDRITNDEKKAQHMSLTDLDKIIDWMKRSRFNSVQLLGGEPMIHPEIRKFVKKLLRNDIKIRFILTNGLADTGLYEKIKKIAEPFWLVNVNHPSTYSKSEWELLNRNLELLKWKRKSNLKDVGFDETSFSLQLAITIYEANQDYSYIIELAKKYDCPYIRYAPSHPSADKKNIHINFEHLHEIKDTLMNFFRDCVENGIKPALECVLPPCIFTQREMRYLLLFTERLAHFCKPHLDVMPDLTVEYCTSMRELLPKYRIEDFRIEEVFNRHDFDAEKFREYELPRCKNCYHFINKQCQGFCLRFKADFLK